MQETPTPLSHTCAVHPHGGLRFWGGVFLALAWLGLSATQAQTTNYVMGMTALVVGPAAGTNSVVLGVTPATGAWTATNNAAWLHLTPANESGTGSTNVIFSYDANSGATRSGSLTIGDQTLSVTQAGSTYVAAGAVTTLISSGLNKPQDVAVDGAGNVYIAAYNGAIKRWTAASGTVTTLVSSGLFVPHGVAVDGVGNVYIADTQNNAIKEWTAANSNVTTLASSGLSYPEGVAVDRAGNVYIADAGNRAIMKWTAANSNVTTLVSSGLSFPNGVAVDGAGKVYIADWGDGMIMKWTAANSTMITLVSGLAGPSGLAVDGAGNVYTAETGDNYAIKEWSAASNTVTTLVSSGLAQPQGVAVDGTGNVYIANTLDNAIKELPYAFVDPSDRLESLAAGNDALPAVLPPTENLLAPFAPTSDQPWLTISGITNGVISVAFTATTSNRTGNITVLGRTIPVTQGAPDYSLGATALLEGPAAGSDSVVLAINPPNGAWTATANTNWLHLSPANQNGTSTTNVVFSYDANPGPTRSGTLTIGDQTLTVTQAGSTYVPAGTLTTLVSSNLSSPLSVAVDGAGNVYIADTGNGAIQEWTPANGNVTTLVSPGLVTPGWVAVDGAGNVYIADTGHNVIKKWSVANSNLTTLVSSNLNSPSGVAVDGVGNVYIADTANWAIKKWTAATSNVTTLVSSESGTFFYGVAVDVAGNVYVSDANENGQSISAIKEWMVANGNVITLVSLPTDFWPVGAALDGAGNVYFTAQDIVHPISKWSAASNTVTTLGPPGGIPSGVAVDGAGNVYITYIDPGAICELPYAFVDPTPKLEGLAAGNDALPVVLPATANLLPPFAPTSDQSWLTITGITNDVVSFSFTANTGPARTANITVLGQTIPITQGFIGTPPSLSGAQMVGNGVLQFSFTNTPSASFTVLSSTNLSLPLSNWTVVGASIEISPGAFQFTSQPTTNDAQCFYGVRSP
jgi:DNA-binding beta-propeller fold protein YncE